MGKSSRKRKSSVKSAQAPEQENERNGEAKQSIEEKISEIFDSMNFGLYITTIQFSESFLGTFEFSGHFGHP